MDENLVQVLLELKVRYFASSYFSIANWIMFNRIQLPDGLLQEDMQEWANEKQLYLAASKINLDGIKSNYEKTIIDRLDSAAALQEKIMIMLVNITESKDAKDIATSMTKIAQLQDEAMAILKVDAYRSEVYEKNKVATDLLLRENAGNAVFD